MKYVKLYESWVNEEENQKEAVQVKDLTSSEISGMTIGDFKKLNAGNKNRIITILQKSLFPGLDAAYFMLPDFEKKDESSHRMFKGTGLKPRTIISSLDKQKDGDSILNLQLKDLDGSTSYKLGRMADLFKNQVTDGKTNPDEFFDRDVTKKTPEQSAEILNIWSSLKQPVENKPIDSSTEKNLSSLIDNYITKDNDGKRLFTQIKTAYGSGFAPKAPKKKAAPTE
jgi:hypothetical protein